MSDATQLRDGQVRLFAGDSRDVLRELADCSIDSVVTDPPYALVSIQKRFGKEGSAPAQHGKDGLYARASAGFMGKQWDTGEAAFATEFWAEVMRVLKPGGHVLSFGGTRTYHRLACAIEDAGFEIRDQIGWAYGSGFPKSHSIELGLWRAVINCQSKDNAQLAVQLSSFLPLASSEEKEPIVVAPALILPEGAPALLTATGREEDLSALTVMSLSASEAENISLSTGWSWERRLVEHSDPRSMSTTKTKSSTTISQEIYSLLTSLLTQKSTLLSETLANGWMWPAAIVASSSVDADTSRAAIPTLTVVGSATWNPVAAAVGLGSALKPSWEPIVVARKPIDGTMVENFFDFGTGALNIDGCRVDGAPEPTRFDPAKHHHDGWRMSATGAEAATNASPLGRWPANLIHDGSDEVLAAFPDAPGQLRTVGPQHGAKDTRGIYGDFGPRDSFDPRIELDKSAARFFYCAKASKADRDAGLDHLPRKAAGLVSETSGQHITRRDEGYEVAPRANTHPTVKPTDLMRYLCRLVTPPGGVVLDPFMGSGSTGKAAVLEGFQFVGIEREAEYMPIAIGRIAWAVGQMDRPDAPVVAKRKPANDNATGHIDMLGAADAA